MTRCLATASTCRVSRKRTESGRRADNRLRTEASPHPGPRREGEAFEFLWNAPGSARDAGSGQAGGATAPQCAAPDWCCYCSCCSVAASLVPAPEPQYLKKPLKHHVFRIILGLSAF